MTYLIDARLEQTEPELRLIETPTGRCCGAWRGEALCKLMEAGGLCPHDFCCAEPACVKELVRVLFLLSAAESTGGRAAAGRKPVTSCRGGGRRPHRRSWAVAPAWRTYR